MLRFESFSYPFFDLNYRADHVGMVSSFLSADDAPAAGLRALYVHIPFCDTICTFCPFVKSVGNAERISAYLQALHVELRTLGSTRRMASWELDAVYIGGGTPSVLDHEQLVALFAVIREAFTLKPDAEISFEFEAKSVDDAKFALLAQLGVTRVSFGVQSFHPATREMVNITATLDQVYAAIEGANKHFTNTNLDMMVGFPGQDFDAACVDASLAARSGIGSVSIYPVDYVMTLPGWQDRIRSGELPQPAVLDERSRMFHEARAQLQRDGMAEQNMYCFGSPDAPPTRYMFSTLYGGYNDECVGVGAGAYSFIRGLAWYNEANERDYAKKAASGRLPIVCSSPGHAYEKGLVFFPKRLTFTMADLDGLGLAEVYQPRIDQIVDNGYATVADGVLRLTTDGKLIYSELMAHFFADHQRRLYLKMCARLDAQVGGVDAPAWLDGSPRARHMGAYNALPTATGRRLPVLSSS
ncbi:radical SAM family heme chaperone HemW [Catellatospora chokoriensis]|uniref:Heme chaperone HemW n=2 Tax=Catellatospora chokoriensis TaxID=310353 RepID=A0A8J3K785_9ACTN|nr:coproporphyrinogen III oxidase [Catellatospora chokoriensis]